MTDWTRDFPWQQNREPAGNKPNKKTILQAPAQLEHAGIPVPFSAISFSPEALAAQAEHEEELGLRLQAEAQGIAAAADRNDGSGGPQGLGPALAAFQDPTMRQKITLMGTGDGIPGLTPADAPTTPTVLGRVYNNEGQEIGGSSTPGRVVQPQDLENQRAPGNLRTPYEVQPTQDLSRLIPTPAFTRRPDPPAPDHLPNYIRNQSDWQHPVNQQLQTMINVQDSLPPPPRPRVQTPDPMFNNWQSPFPAPLPRINEPDPSYQFNNPTQTQMIQFLARLPR